MISSMDIIEVGRNFLTIISVLTTLVAGWFLYKQIQFRVWKLPPGPLGLPYLGYVPFFDKEPCKVFDRLSKKYGPFYSITLGSFRSLIVSDYESAKEILSHPASFGRPEGLFDILPGGGGFGGQNGDEWQEQRKFCMQTMRSLGLGRGPWEEIIQKDVAEFVQYLQRWKGNSIDVSGPLIRTTTSNIIALLTGQRFSKESTNPDMKIIERYHYEITEHFKLSNPAAMIPWLRKYCVKFNIAGYAEKMKVFEQFGNILRREIQKHQDSADVTDSMDFIGYYLEALKKKNATNERHYYSVENLVGHMLVLFTGGSDTTIASTYWLLVLMAAYPEVQKQVQQELDEVIGRGRQVFWDDRKELPYTMAAIFEMERWATIVPFFVPRCATETFEFRNYIIPKDTMIVVNGWTMHQDPIYWSHPEEFVPERFLQTAEKSGKDPLRSSGYGPFSFGKRNCPGETIAMMTIFLYLTGLMQKFTIKAPPGLRANLNKCYAAVVHPMSQELCFIER